MINKTAGSFHNGYIPVVLYKKASGMTQVERYMASKILKDKTALKTQNGNKLNMEI